MDGATQNKTVSGFPGYMHSTAGRGRGLTLGWCLPVAGGHSATIPGGQMSVIGGNSQPCHSSNW